MAILRRITMKLNKFERKTIYNALVEYEERCYSFEGMHWQKRINKLIDNFRRIVRIDDGNN